ncbi:MAG: O-methyltransferase [Halanaeroarchaeum sp.]
MTNYLDPTVEAILSLGHGVPDDVIAEMDAYGRETNFPTVGPDVGRFLRVATLMADAERVFEFGSGFGYSAVWMADALPAQGEIVLTDYDEENVDRARTFLQRAGYEDRATFHVGDAADAFENTRGSFDVVLIDHEKRRYVEAFDLVADRLTPGDIVIADNVLDGPVNPGDVRAGLEGEEPTDETTDGIVSYVQRVRDDPSVETVVVPLGQGIAVSVFVESE